jgi:hypothetical protein
MNAFYSYSEMENNEPVIQPPVVISDDDLDRLTDY